MKNLCQMEKAFSSHGTHVDCEDEDRFLILTVLKFVLKSASKQIMYGLHFIDRAIIIRFVIQFEHKNSHFHLD